MKDECRICCLQIDYEYCQPIREYLEMLLYVSGTIILPDQPQSICSKCVNELEVSFNFKKKCEQAETFFANSIKCETVFEDEAVTLPLEEPLVEGVFENESEDFQISQDLQFNAEETKVKPGSKKNAKLKFHIKVQTEELESHCKITEYDRDETKPATRDKSKKTHDGENWSFCPYCGKMMGSKYLTRHINDIHTAKKDRGPDLICDLCDEKYKTKAGIIVHMKKVHLCVKYQCQFCNEIFPSYGIKRNHEIHFHTFKYKYECNICHHKFIVNRDYKKHLTTHTGEKNYLCTICGKRLSRKSVLDLHMATHSDIRSHSCKICKASFKTTKSLKVHQMVHEERKYECPVCQQRFLVNQALRQHVQKRHPEFELPPPGTIMNKRALQRIEEISTKYNIKVNTASFRLLPSQREDSETVSTISAKSIINSNFQKKVTKSKILTTNTKTAAKLIE